MNTRNFYFFILGTLLLVSLISLTSASPTVTLNNTALVQNITITGSGDLNISWLNATINNASLIQQTEAKQYITYIPIYISSANINTTITDTDVTWLRLNGTGNTISFTTNSAPSKLTINNTIISSWLDTDYDYNPNDGRASLTLSTSTTRINNVTFLYLGNVTWITPGASYGVVFNGGGGVSYIRNSNFTGNYMGIHISSSGMDKANITSNTFTNNSYDDMYITPSAGLKNISIQYNNFTRPGRYSIEFLAQVASGSRDNIISGNNFIQNTTNNLGSILVQGNSTLIDSNNFYGGGTIFSLALKTTNTRNLRITNNFVQYTQYNFWIFSSDYNITIENNTLTNGDMGSDIRHGNLLFFINNTIKNMSFSYDGFDVGVRIKNYSNVYIQGNNFSEVATTGILSQRNQNLTITNNQFYTIPLNQRSLYKATDYGDARCAISIVELYESYLGSNEENTDNDNVTYIGQFNSTNVTIKDNTFDSNTECFLRTEGTTGLTHDLTNVWIPTFQTPAYLKDIMQYYISNSYNNISSFYTTRINYTIIWNYDLGAVQSKPKMSGTITRDYWFLKNVNTTTGISFDTNLFNQTNALVYFSNSSGFICSNLCNITLTQNNHSYILDNFNLTEGVSRQFSPIGFTSLNNDQKIISSNLSVLINSPTVILTNSPERLIRITYNGSTFEKAQFNISGNQVSFSGLNIPAGSSTLNLVYGCTGNESFVFSLILILTSLAIVISTFTLVYNKDKIIDKIGIGKFVTVFVGLCIGIGFLIQIGNNIFIYCGVL